MCYPTAVLLFRSDRCLNSNWSVLDYGCCIFNELTVPKITIKKHVLVKIKVKLVLVVNPLHTWFVYTTRIRTSMFLLLFNSCKAVKRVTIQMGACAQPNKRPDRQTDSLRMMRTYRIKFQTCSTHLRCSKTRLDPNDNNVESLSISFHCCIYNALCFILAM